MPFVNWLSPSFEDDSGHASYRRLTPFFLTAACIYIGVFQIKGDELKRDIILIFLIVSAFYASIVTFQNVYSLYVAWKGGPAVQTPPDVIKADDPPPAPPDNVVHASGDLKITQNPT